MKNMCHYHGPAYPQISHQTARDNLRRGSLELLPLLLIIRPCEDSALPPLTGIALGKEQHSFEIWWACAPRKRERRARKKIEADVDQL